MQRNRLSKSLSSKMLVHKCNFLLQLLLKVNANFYNVIATKTCPHLDGSKSIMRLTRVKHSQIETMLF